MRSKLNRRNFRQTTVMAQTEDVVEGYLKDRIGEYWVAADKDKRDLLDIKVYGFLQMAFGSDLSAIPYCKSLNYYNTEKMKYGEDYSYEYGTD